MNSYEITDHVYDVVVVGAGGAGLKATLGMAEQGLKTACVANYFLREVIRLPRKEELRHRYQIWVLIIGTGICMIL